MFRAIWVQGLRVEGYMGLYKVFQDPKELPTMESQVKHEMDD